MALMLASDGGGNYLAGNSVPPGCCGIVGIGPVCAYLPHPSSYAVLTQLQCCHPYCRSRATGNLHGICDRAVQMALSANTQHGRCGGGYAGPCRPGSDWHCPIAFAYVCVCQSHPHFHCGDEFHYRPWNLLDCLWRGWTGALFFSLLASTVSECFVAFNSM